MKKLNFYFFLILFSTCSQLANAYVHNQTKQGTPIHWPSSASTVDIYVNSENSRGLLEASVQSIATNSITEWNSFSKITLRKNDTQTKDQPDFNEIYFSNDPTIFNGGGVIGLTQVSYNESTGEIYEADILINDNYAFSTTNIDQNFLGNVITHEVGHLLGLGHGQVAGSTMFYALSRGQYDISDDDKAGVYSIYPSVDSTKGSLTGKVVGGKNLINVFGAHVQAVSVKTGKVMGASISELDGKFKIDGLPRDDKYLIYTSPIKQLGLPANYSTVQSDFCEASKKYRGSFFQSCGSSSEGLPQAIDLNSAALDLGNVTIRCGLDSPPDFLHSKNITPAVFDLNSTSINGIGGSFVGFFSNSEMQSGVAHDYFKLNLTQVDWDSISSAANLYLEVKVLNQTFYSPFKTHVSINNVDVTPINFVDIDGRYNIETIARVPIDKAISSVNNFEIKITPEAIGDLLTQLNTGPTVYQKDDFFPASTTLDDDLSFYLVITSIVKDNGNGTYTQVSTKQDSLSDNTQCTDAVNTYSLTNYSAKGTTASGPRKKSGGCGTIDDSANGPSGGPGGFMVGLFLSFIISYALSRYSKMA